MKYDRFFEKDPFWQSLKAQPEVMGWEKRAIPESKIHYLFVGKSQTNRYRNFPDVFN